MAALPIFLLAAVAEIAGCFAFWAWLRQGRPMLWIVPGIALLILFAWALTRIDAPFAGRAYAAYGGVYVVTSLGWLWVVEGFRPDRWDVAGAALCLLGGLIIIASPR